MRNDMYNRFELHREWVETSGQEGEQLRLQDVDFCELDISDICLEQSFMASCTFEGLSLNNIDFHASVLSSSLYKNSNLIHCDFYKSDLSNAEFSNSNLDTVRFSRGDLWETRFDNATIKNCNFSTCNLSLTDFSYASLTDVDISEARFEGVLFYGVTLRNIKGIEEANFHSINIGSADKPQILKGQEARDWLRMKAEERK